MSEGDCCVAADFCSVGNPSTRSSGQIRFFILEFTTPGRRCLAYIDWYLRGSSADVVSNQFLSSKMAEGFLALGG